MAAAGAGLDQVEGLTPELIDGGRQELLDQVEGLTPELIGGVR